MSILLAPDVYVNASVAGVGLAPEAVVNRILGDQKNRHRTTEWILSRVEAMLNAHPNFKTEAVGGHMKTIRGLVDIVEIDEPEDPDDWGAVLAASARAMDVKRVVTDHPDLADKDEIDGVEFLSSDAWMVEQTTPPPPPPGKS